MDTRVVLALCMFVSLTTKASAGPQDRGFFQKDYARGMQPDKPGPLAKPQNAVKSTPSQPTYGAAQPQPAPTTDATEITPLAKSHEKLSPREVPRVELFVNSADANHLNQVVARAVSLHKKGRIFLIGISHIGDYRTLSAENNAEITQSGIRYTAVPSVAYGDHIKSSPVWAFVSPEGARLIEGCLDPERYINTNGAEPPTTKLDAMNKQEDKLAGITEW